MTTELYQVTWLHTAIALLPIIAGVIGYFWAQARRGWPDD